MENYQNALSKQNEFENWNLIKSWNMEMKLVGWLVGFYGISNLVGYLMSNPLYTYKLNIFDLVWLGFMAYQPL